jgi:hypothetical protein
VLEPVAEARSFSRTVRVFGAANTRHTFEASDRTISDCPASTARFTPFGQIRLAEWVRVRFPVNVRIFVTPAAAPVPKLVTVVVPVMEIRLASGVAMSVVAALATVAVSWLRACSYRIESPATEPAASPVNLKPPMGRLASAPPRPCRSKEFVSSPAMSARVEFAHEAVIGVPDTTGFPAGRL